MAITPAYNINLSSTQKRLVCDIAAIQSQIEWLMRMTVQELLDVPPHIARQIMGSTNFNANAEIWIGCLRTKKAGEKYLPWAEWATTKIQWMTANRNAYLHTLFGMDTRGQPQGDVSFRVGHRPSWRFAQLRPAAVRVKSNKPADLEALADTYRKICFISRVVAHVQWSAGPKAVPSPWRDTLVRGMQTQFPLDKLPLNPTKQDPRPA